ncbi:MAG: hypothetical protein WBG46_05080 [Nonlabens sp.]
MTKKDLFIIIIRILGLYMLFLIVFEVLPTNLAVLSIEDNYTVMLLILANLLVFSALFFLLIRYAGKIVSLLKLDAGLSNEIINLKFLKTTDILRVGIVLLGGFLIIFNIADFLFMCFMAFKSNLPTQSYMESNKLNFNDYLYWFVYAVNILIGYLLIRNVNRVADFLNKSN